MGRIVTIEGIRPKDKFLFRIFLPSELATSLGLVSTEVVTGVYDLEEDPVYNLPPRKKRLWV